MTWKAFHHRGDVLRTVIDTAAERGDGILPSDVAGVSETFTDELDLLGALQMRWYTRLSGRIEREFSDEPLDPEAAVIAGWQQAAEELPGAREVLDRYREQPADEAMAEVMQRAAHKEHVMMAAMAGRGGETVAATRAQGRAIEEKARSTRAVAPARAGGVDADAGASGPVGYTPLVSRLRAALAA